MEKEETKRETEDGEKDGGRERRENKERKEK